ncbi:MAG TPA: hypothetical protein DCF33_08105 [Saprospirales bacterium]|nr:hypothetical protein [Saprospirales bacterium]
MKNKNKISKAQSEVWEWKEIASASLLEEPAEAWLRIVNTRTEGLRKDLAEKRKKTAKKNTKVSVPA